MSAAPVNRPPVVDLVVAATGPVAADGAKQFNASAREYRLWKVQASQALDNPPDIAIGTRDIWHPTEWVDSTTVRVLLAGPQASSQEGAVAVVPGGHRTWLRATKGSVEIVRPTSQLRVV